jgi:Fe-Mn family superoxide dismutase
MHTLTRRQLLQAAGAGAAALALAHLSPLSIFAEVDEPGFKLPPLPYDYDALKVSIDEETMKIHHDKHHQAYITNLNAALKDNPDYFKKSIEEILMDIDKVPDKIKQAVINNGGGHANHSFFWKIMSPKGGGQPDGALAKGIDAAFGSFDKFQAAVNDAGLKQFGSGWAWLVSDNKGKLEVISTANQDSPLMKGQTPIIGVDVWEHAYYLRYKNVRKDYLEAWWKVVNWKEAADHYAAATKGKGT